MRINQLGAAIIAALFLFGMPVPVVAQDVTLTSRDGLIVLKGTMQAHDGGFYRVQTDYGLLTLDASGVRCAGPGCPNLTDPPAAIVIALPASVAGLMPTLIEAFAKAEGLQLVRAAFGMPGGEYGLRDPVGGQEVARITVALRPGEQALADLAAGRATFALSMRGLPGLPGEAQIMALDAAVAIVAPGNPVRTIRLADLSAVMAGKITTWAALGGGDAPILLHLPAAESGLPAAVEPTLGKLAAPALHHADLADLATAVARDPWALGLTSAAQTGAARALALDAGCGLAASASDWGIRSGDYPLTLPLFLYGAEATQPLIARQLLEWLTSPQAQAQVRKAGWVDLTPQALPLADQGDRLAQAIARAGDLADLQTVLAGLAGSERLSTTFRFLPGKRTLDPPSRAALAVLARTLEAGMHDGQDLLFAGFAGGKNAAAVSAALAEAVRDAAVGNAPLMDGARVHLSAAGFGDALPQACAPDGASTGDDRRVELWLRPTPVAKDTQTTEN